MHYKLIFYLMLISLIGCKGSPLSTKEPPDYGLGWNFIYWYIIDPELKRKEKCSQPNAILTSIGESSSVGCINGKVTQGFIYDASTKQIITTDTVSPGPSFLCKCNSVISRICMAKKGHLPS